MLLLFVYQDAPPRHTLILTSIARSELTISDSLNRLRMLTPRY